LSRTYNAKVPLPLDLAHRRYVQQAGWTEPLRRHLLQRAGLSKAQRVLDVGCGTGAVLNTINDASVSLIGLDLDLAALYLARSQAPRACLASGDAHQLPYRNGVFDIVYFHFVLLWLREPRRALAEARRVSRPGGAVLAFAEPDYSGRIDEPASLAQLGKLQTEALRAQGADPELGRKLVSLFQSSGFTGIESGQLHQQKGNAKKDDDGSLEWEILRADVRNQIPADELYRLAQEDRQARQAGERVLFVPTFYACARV